MAATKTYTVYREEGHTLGISYDKSFVLDFSTIEKVRRIEVDCSDKTGTNDYVIVRITRDTEPECDNEMWGQECDGLFENERVGKISGYSLEFLQKIY